MSALRSLTPLSPPLRPLQRRAATRPGAVDIIGDVHGHADALHDLLDRLGYRRSGGVWQHPNFRQAVFTGDLIDHGPDPRGVLQTVSEMVRAGHARCVMGNHEFDALLHHRKDADGVPLRPMTEWQLAAHVPTLRTLARAFPVEWAGWLKWMQALPLWYDAGYFRVIHACWDREARTFFIRPLLDDRLLAACAEDGLERQFVETLLKGPALKHNGHRVRLRWWQEPPPHASLQDVAVDELPGDIAHDAVPAEARFTPYSPEAPVLFVGHYNQEAAAPVSFTPKVICVDTGVGRGGRLSAWRFDEPARLPVFAA